MDPNRHRTHTHGPLARMVQALGVATMVATLVACSAQKNTARSRWWHSFNARYNTYYNGHEAFIDGNEQKEKGNKDNYTETLPLYMVGNKQSRALGKASYDRAIEKSEKTIKMHSIKARPKWNKSRPKTDKDREWLSRREYNPFLWKPWLMMGQAQFQKGEFEEAAATFSYMSKLYQGQPAIRQRAQDWLARCYVEMDWLYEAEDVLRKQSRDSIHYRAVRDWQAAQASYLLRSGQLAEAVPYLKKVIRNDRHGYRKARHCFILGQVEAALGHEREAYKAYQKALRQSPPYELAFNARIAQTEVLAGRGQGNGQLTASARKMVRRLRSMARSDNNKDYLDQVYYAIGNIYMSAPDTLKALEAYEKGAAKATRTGIEKGVLLLRMGDVYWALERYNDAQRCYAQAVGLLDKERPDYEQLADRSKKLDELVPHTDAIHLQDSLQELAQMPEAERLAAIDRVIEELVRKEKEEKRKQQEAEVEKQAQKGGAQGAARNRDVQQPTVPGQGNGEWYFYNPMAVSQGKQTFQRQWGKRENTDDWQRSNRTVVGSLANLDNPAMDNAEANDSLPALNDAEEALQDSISQAEKQRLDSAQNDPHQREYYLAQIPFTEEQVAASNDIIKEALLQSGIIFKDKMDNLRLAEKQFSRLRTQYADYPQMDLALYHLYLLYMRMGQVEKAQQCVEDLKAQYPESEWTILLSDPYFVENQRFGTHIEDSLYAATYAAFLAQQYQQVRGNSQVSEERFPLGEHRPKFLFVDGMACLNEGDAEGCLQRMKTVVEKYPQSEVAEMAGMIVQGVNTGRVLHGGQFDLGDIWSLRGVSAQTDSTNKDTLSAERNVAFFFILAYQPDSLVLETANGGGQQTFTASERENQLLFQVARYNFTNFMVRNFDISIERQDYIHRLTVSGFLSYDEALQYARQLYSSPDMALLLRPCRRIIISEQNLPLLGTRFSYNDYDDFYLKTLAPLEVSDEQLLLRPDVIVQPSEDDVDATEDEESPDGGDAPAGDPFDFPDDFF